MSPAACWRARRVSRAVSAMVSLMAPMPGDGVHLHVGARPAHGELPVPAPPAATRGDVFEQFVGEPGPIQPDQHVVPERPRQPGDRQVEQGDIVVRAVGGGVARARVDRQHVVGVVADRQVRAEPGAALYVALAFSLSEPASTIEASRSITVIPVSSFPATFSHGNPSGRAASRPHQCLRNSATAAFIRASCRSPVSLRVRHTVEVDGTGR
jgi:hypothetical protein